MPMERSKLRPVMRAVKTVLETVQADGANVAVGLSVAPDCARPFYIVTSVSSPRYTGPMDNTEIDGNDRIQVTATSLSVDQADWLRDEARDALTVAALDAAFVTLGYNRRILRVILDIPRGVQRDDRGLPEPIFNSVDQYMIETTPS